MRLRIALCDPDPDYARRIAEYARNGELRRELDITVCTRPELLAEWRKEGRFDVYAVGVEYADAVGPVAPDDRSVVWIGERSGGVGPNGAPVALKYAAAPALVRSWAGAAAVRGTSGGSAVVGVWSPAGGAGRTRLIAHLAGIRARGGLRTFVAGIDPGAVPAAHEGDAGLHDAADWLFDIKSEGTVGSGSVRPDEGRPLHAFAPDCSYREWSGIGRSEGGKLLDAAASVIGHGIVLADAGGGWSPWAEAVCGRSDVIVCVVPCEEVAVAKTDRWLRDWPEWEEGGAYRSKTMFVLNRCLRETEAPSRTWAESSFKLPYVPEWKQDARRNDPMFQRAAERLAGELRKRCEER